MKRTWFFWFAMGFALNALITLTIFEYYNFHGHDSDSGWIADDTAKIEPYWNDDGTIQWNDTTFSLPQIGAAKKGEVLQDDGTGTLTWQPDSIIHSEAYGSYPAEVPFTQGMTIMPGQRAKLKMEWPNYWLKVETENGIISPEVNPAWLLLDHTETDTTK